MIGKNIELHELILNIRKQIFKCQTDTTTISLATKSFIYKFKINSPNK